MKKDNELHLTCSCHSHELHFEKDSEYNQWFISFWQRGYITDTSWKYRLKCIWHILRTGRPYGDEVILEVADMVELKEYIKHQLDNIKM
jgi:hypothetical protein